MNLAGKVALVTGGSRGIGRAIAISLSTAGAKVVVNYNSNSSAANEVVSLIQAAGGEALAIQADVVSSADVDRLVKTTHEKFGSLDILINNAGITRDKLILRMTESDWDAVIDTNLKGAFLCCKSVAPIMVKQRSGAIVNVGSVIGRVGAAGQVNYSAAKAGLVGLTKALAKELGGRNVRVNAIAPGFIETDMTDGLKEEYRETIRKEIPLNRFGSAIEIAGVVVFLCSEAASYIHGEVITVDGGLFM